MCLRLQRRPSRRKSGGKQHQRPGGRDSQRLRVRPVVPAFAAEPWPALLQNDLNHLNRKKRIAFNMKTEHTMDKPARAGRATQIVAIVITGLVAFIWVYFGRLYLIHDPSEWRIANQQLGYPLYIIPLIGVTHILGGVGLLIPNVPRLTEWVYAGIAIDLLLAFYSQMNGGGSTWDKFDPILVMAFVFASYVLRRCMHANRWSI
jgi:uncharacterized membrane protein YphA (DoxX/SURF4 family)